jgi:hypothetical protein
MVSFERSGALVKFGKALLIFYFVPHPLTSNAEDVLKVFIFYKCRTREVKCHITLLNYCSLLMEFTETISI